MPVLVQCIVCNKNQFVPASRAAKYKTCSIECMGKMFAQDRAEQKIEKICPSCEKLFSLKKSSQKGDSDIFSLTLIEKIKHAGELEIYDTGIKIQPEAG